EISKLNVPDPEEKYHKLIFAENQRVEFELRANLPESVCFPAGGDIQALISDYTWDLEKGILSDNPAFDVLVEIPWELNFKVFQDVKNTLMEILKLKEPDRIRMLRGKGLSTLSVQLSAEGILAAPLPVKEILRAYELEKDGFSVAITLEGETPLKEGELVLLDPSGNILTDVELFDINIDTLELHWSELLGNRLSLSGGERFRLNLTDTLGLSDTAYSEPITIYSTDRVQSEMITSLTRCEFDLPQPVSLYQVSQLPVFVEGMLTIIDSAGAGYELTITGHADTIGEERYNNELSRRRAELGYILLFDQISFQGGFRSHEEAENWLKAIGVTVTIGGQGATRPARILFRENNELREKILGENRWPEGRLLNRRIEISFKAARKGLKE
ncbi:hypothetical protein JW877_00700, partial [bacterium]|nr:hypothetical protein [bacterium]